MFWIALSAAVSQLNAPVPQAMWFSNDDFPIRQMAGKEFAVVKLRLTIMPDGKLQSCEVEWSTGNQYVDKYTCDLTRRRAQFRPARAEDGTPSYGVLRMPVIWTVAPLDRGPHGDLVLTVSRLPKGVHPPASVRLMFSVDEEGRLSSCTAEPFPSMRKPNLVLAPLACDQLAKQYKPTPAKDETGKTVRSIQDASVEFDKD
jgi:hypothetical protein